MNVIIRNRKVNYEYTILDKYLAGIQLSGTEVKSIKNTKASIAEAFCVIENDEIYIRNMHISEYANIQHTNHTPIRDRKLLLHKTEINKLSKAVKEKGLTIQPLNVIISTSGFIKLEIALCKGKKVYDKRASLKEKDLKKDND